MKETQSVPAGDSNHEDGTTPNQEKKCIVLFQGRLDTLNLFTGQLKRGFLELGYEIYDFDLSQIYESLNMLVKYMQDHPITAMVSFNNPFFSSTTPSGENLLEKLGVPSVNILVDHPFWYHDEILMHAPANGAILCVDRNHMNYVHRFYPHIPINGFLPLGGVSFQSTHKPISERKIDVLYAGSLKEADVSADFSGWDFPVKQILEHLIVHTEDTIEDVIEQELLKAGVILTDEELRKFISLSVNIENLISSYYREKVVSSIAKAGISLELYGEGWGGCDWINLPNVRYGGWISPEEIIVMMEDTKIVLNSMPWFRDGGHDRVFNAMMCGAVAVSETTRYFEEVLPPDTWESFELTPESLAELPLRVEDLLSDVDRMQKIANAGHDLAVAEHTWKSRALELHRDLLSQL